MPDLDGTLMNLLLNSGHEVDLLLRILDRTKSPTDHEDFWEVDDYLKELKFAEDDEDP